MSLQTDDRMEAAGSVREEVAALYDRTFARVYNTIRYRVDDENVAQDLTTIVYERVIYSLDNYLPDEGPIDAWLFGIVRNVVGDYLRRLRFTAWLPWENFLRRPGDDPPLEEIVIRHELEAQLAKSLPGLKERERDLLGLKYGAGLTNRRIAELTGLSEQNVGVILYRALNRLRELMGRDHIHLFSPCDNVEVERV